MAWTTKRPAIFALSVLTFSLSSCYRRKHLIYLDSAENENSKHYKKQVNIGNWMLMAHEEKDLLRNHEGIAYGISGWVGKSGVRQYHYSALRKHTSLAFSSFVMDYGATWTFFSISEGIKGSESSVFLFDTIIPSVLAELDIEISKRSIRSGDMKRIYPSVELGSHISSEDEVDAAIKTAFLNVDHAIVTQASDTILSSPSKALNADQLATALTGATELLAFYDYPSNNLKIANTGDSRAVLARPKAGGNGTIVYEVHVLTVEHDSNNPAELERLENSHPNTRLESLRTYINRDLTRAFGLSMCKWGEDIQGRLHNDYLGEPPLKDVDTRSPFLIAEPDITTFKVRGGDFLIMANKGFWNSLKTEEAVGLVALWSQRRQTVSAGLAAMYTEETIHYPQQLPAIQNNSSEDQTIWYRRWNVPKNFVLIDDDAATHLVRNALGGANADLTNALLRIPHPISALSRDEMAVVVVFFDDNS